MWLHIVFLIACEISNWRISLPVCLVQVKFRQAALTNPYFNDHYRYLKYLRQKGNSLYSQRLIHNFEKSVLPSDSIKRKPIMMSLWEFFQVNFSYVHIYFSSRSITMIWISFVFGLFSEEGFYLARTFSYRIFNSLSFTLSKICSYDISFWLFLSGKSMKKTSVRFWSCVISLWDYLMGVDLFSLPDRV